MQENIFENYVNVYNTVLYLPYIPYLLYISTLICYIRKKLLTSCKNYRDHERVNIIFDFLYCDQFLIFDIDHGKVNQIDLIKHRQDLLDFN